VCQGRRLPHGNSEAAAALSVTLAPYPDNFVASQPRCRDKGDRVSAVELHSVKPVFTFTLNEDLADPYALFDCRSDFDADLRRALSCRRLDCTGSPSGGSWPYTANFGQRIARDPDAVRRHQKPPLPFVFQFPVFLPMPNGGSTFECSLTLFGNAVQYLGYYLAAVKLFLDGIHASQAKVEAECPRSARAPVAAGKHLALPLLSTLDPTPVPDRFFRTGSPSVSSRR